MGIPQKVNELYVSQRSMTEKFVALDSLFVELESRVEKLERFVKKLDKKFDDTDKDLQSEEFESMTKGKKKK